MKLNLLDAEPGTQIKLVVKQNVADVKKKIEDFVNAYNDTMKFINRRTYVDPATGQAGKLAILVGNTTVASIRNTLTSMASGVAQGLGASSGSDNYQTLGDIGLKLQTAVGKEDKSQINTLSIDNGKLESALVNNPDAVRKLFTFNFTSDNPKFSLLGFNGNTAPKSGGYNLALNFASGKIGSGTLDGTADSLTVSGKTVQAAAATVRASIFPSVSGRGSISRWTGF